MKLFFIAAGVIVLLLGSVVYYLTADYFRFNNNKAFVLAQTDIKEIVNCSQDSQNMRLTVEGERCYMDYKIERLGPGHKRSRNSSVLLGLLKYAQISLKPLSEKQRRDAKKNGTVFSKQNKNQPVYFSFPDDVVYFQHNDYYSFGDRKYNQVEMNSGNRSADQFNCRENTCQRNYASNFGTLYIKGDEQHVEKFLRSIKFLIHYCAASLPAEGTIHQTKTGFGRVYSTIK